MKGSSLKFYLQDSFLAGLFEEVKIAGNMKSSLLDITHKCNLRCVGCYFFMENMDDVKKVSDPAEFDAFVDTEKARGTNMLTVVGGEPALEIDRLRLLAKHFKLTVVTNGSLVIPQEGLEDIRIAISFWGDESQDVLLRGQGNRHVFSEALKNFRGDPRVGFYYTTVAGFAAGIESATDRMIQNGNFVAYNFYADLANQGGKYSHRKGFEKVIEKINWMIAQYPDRIVSSPHINNVIAKRELFGVPWGYNVCPSVTFDHPQNQERMRNGKKYPTRFRAYNADLKTTRRCCIGNARDCDTCTDLWATYGWVVGSLKEHLRSEQDFTHWLLTTYIFYMQTGFIDINKHHHKLPEIYRRFHVETRGLQLQREALIPATEIE